MESLAIEKSEKELFEKYNEKKLKDGRNVFKKC